MIIDIVNRKIAKIIGQVDEKRSTTEGSLNNLEDLYFGKLPEGTRFKCAETTVHVVLDDRELVEQLRADNLSLLNLLHKITRDIDGGKADTQKISSMIRKVMAAIGTPKTKDPMFNRRYVIDHSLKANDGYFITDRAKEAVLSERKG